MQIIFFGERLKKELWGLFKYGLVGGSSFLLHACIYGLLSRVVWADGHRTVEYVIALFFASLYNFTLHRIWTFSMNGYSHFMALRYATTILISMGIQSLLFYIGYERLGFYDYAVLIVAAGVAAVTQYLAHRFFTFNKKFEENVRGQGSGG